MNILNEYFEELKQYLELDEVKNNTKIHLFDSSVKWPKSETSNIIFNSDTSVELGNPKYDSLSFLMFTNSLEKINDGNISIIGSDLNELRNKQVAFGKIVLIGCKGLNEENAYKRYQELDLVRFKLYLDGYMLKAMSQRNLEWSRISHKGLDAGFSLKILGNELIREYKKLEYVESVEIIFVTEFENQIRELSKVGEKSSKVITAMNKIFDDLEYDCNNCDFEDVCGEIDGLKEMHKNHVKDK